MPEHTPAGFRRFLLLASDPRGMGWPVWLVTLATYSVADLRSAAVLARSFTLSELALDVVCALLAQLLLLTWAHRTVLPRLRAAGHVHLGLAVILFSILLAGELALRVSPALESPAMWIERAWVYLLICVAWASIDDYRSTLARERLLQVRLAEAAAAVSARVEEQRANVVGRIGAMFEESLREVAAPAEASDVLRDLARQRIRPLSHELMRAVPPYEPSWVMSEEPPSWRSLLDAASRRPLLSPKLMAIAVTLLSLTQTGQRVTAAKHDYSVGSSTGLALTVDVESLLLSLTYLTAIFVTTWLAAAFAVRLTRNRVADMELHRRLMWVLSAPFALALFEQIVMWFAYFAPGLAQSAIKDFGPRLFVTLPIFIVAFLLLIVRAIAELFDAAQRRQRELESRLAWETARANETLQQERRFLATAVHGPLQSSVAAAAMSLEEARRTGASIDIAWSQVRQHLLEAVRSLADGPPDKRDLQRELATMRDTWRGLCEVHVEASPATMQRLATDWVTAGTVSDLLTEAVSNAAVHGEATNVQITLQASEATLLIDVCDDGRPGDHASPATGLGSQQLDEVAIHWRRDFNAQGTRLEVVLPLSA